MNNFRRCFAYNSIFTRLCQENASRPGVRFLYNDQFLGMDKYAEGRERTLARMGNMKESFYQRMQQQLGGAGPSMVFTEDLKTMIHSCEDKPEEIDIFLRMMKRFHKQNKELRFGTFVFGPVAMRLFYYLNKQGLMLEVMKDPELNGFFDQLKSYLLCMDLYFKNGMYVEVLEAFQALKKKDIADTKYPREAMVLACGSCYKLNTPETYQMATELITQAREARVPIIRKALLFVSALAINQNHPDVALEILSSIDRLNNMTGNNLKITALADLDRVQDAFDILRRVTDQDVPLQTKARGEICQSTLDAVQKAVDRLGDTESTHIFEQLCRSLKESNSITSQGIDALVCLPIEPRQMFREGGGDGYQFRQRGRFPESASNFGPRDPRDFRGGEDYPPRRRQFASYTGGY